MKRALLFLAACAPDAPATPNYQEDVAPILTANCVRCHGVPQIGGAPREFRLDLFSDTLDGGTVLYMGASTMAPTIAIKIESDDAPMPPRFPLDDYQIDTLKNWAARPADREPRLGNHRPTIVVQDTRQVVSGDGTEPTIDVTITLRVDDEDHDLVGGWLQLAGRTTNVLHSGTNTIGFAAATGDYSLVAVLDDGGVQVTYALGTVHVEVP
jgi:hypothetical protein